jgi:tetratricopeptide (TPR) repeat protein
MVMKNVVLAICLLTGFTARSQRVMDSLLAVWNNKLEVDTVRMLALSLICQDYYAYTKPDTALLLTSQLLDMAQQRHLDHFAGTALNGRMAAFTVQEKFDSALACGKRAFVIFQRIRFYRGVVVAGINIGVMYKRMGDNHKALALFYKVLKLQEHLGDSLSMSATLVNMASIYQNLGKPDSVLKLHERALVITERHGPTPTLVVILTNLGNGYMRKKQMEKAFPFFQRAEKLAEEFGNGTRLATVYQSLIDFYREKDEFEKALEYQRKSAAIYEATGSRISKAINIYYLSTIYCVMGRLREARVTAEDAIQMLGNDKVPALRRDMYSDLSKIYSNQKKYERSLELYRRFIMLRDSLRDDSLSNALIAEQSRSAMERKELLLKNAGDKRLMAAQAEANSRDQEKNTWILVVLSLLLILALSAYFTYRHWRHKNIIADQKNRLLSEKLLISQMNPHFIFNSLNSIQNFIFRQDNYLAGVYLKQFSELMRMILEFSRREYISLEEEYRFLVSYLDLQKLRFDGKLDYRIVIDEQLDRESVLIPPMLGQPFAENAIEHGIFHLEGQGMLWIRIRPEKGMLIYEIEDNGVGLAAAKTWKKARHKSLATDIIRERLNALHQEDSEKNRLEIIDKNSLPGMGSGVIVKFAVP